MCIYFFKTLFCNLYNFLFTKMLTEIYTMNINKIYIVSSNKWLTIDQYFQLLLMYLSSQSKHYWFKFNMHAMYSDGLTSNFLKINFSLSLPHILQIWVLITLTLLYIRTSKYRSYQTTHYQHASCCHNILQQLKFSHNLAAVTSTANQYHSYNTFINQAKK